MKPNLFEKSNSSNCALANFAKLMFSMTAFYAFWRQFYMKTWKQKAKEKSINSSGIFDKQNLLLPYTYKPLHLKASPVIGPSVQLAVLQTVHWTHNFFYVSSFVPSTLTHWKGLNFHNNKLYKISFQKLAIFFASDFWFCKYSFSLLGRVCKWHKLRGAVLVVLWYF